MRLPGKNGRAIVSNVGPRRNPTRKCTRVVWQKTIQRRNVRANQQTPVHGTLYAMDDSRPFHKRPRTCPPVENEISNGDRDGIRTFWILQALTTENDASTSLTKETDDIDRTSIQQELQKLSKQLHIIKQKLAHPRFRHARTYCNPYESLDTIHTFLNRSAIKLVNMDHVLNIVTSNCCTNKEGKTNGALVFCDLCGAPGGFSEYVLCKGSALGWYCVGYAMSLQTRNEHGQGRPWKLDSFYDDYCQFTIYHGKDRTGDVYKYDNILGLQEKLSGSKADLVLADGGFDQQRNASNQEELTQKIIVCETMAALMLLNRHGTFVIKCFGFQTPVVRSVLQYLYENFESVTCIKPITSRPASAERYVVCKNYVGSETELDGKKWYSNMLLGKSRITIGPSLDHFDRDMLQLNLDNCFQIVSYLEHPERYQATVDQPIIHTAAYKMAWNLY